MTHTILATLALLWVCTFPMPASAVSLLDDLVAYYSFNGNALDQSGNGHDGTVSGATPTVDRFGNADSAYHFNGVDSFIDIGNGVKPGFPLTIGLWLKADELIGGNVFRNDAVNHAGNRYGLALYTDETGQVHSSTYEGFSAPSNRLTYTSNESVYSAGDWNHFAIVFNANDNREMYWNGILIDGTFSGSGSNMVYSSGDGQIGVTYDNSTPTSAFLGDLDNITVHSRALSSDEIDSLMNFAVPIPAAAWLFGSALLGLAGLKRKKA